MRHLYASSFLMDDWLRRLYNLMAEMNDNIKRFPGEVMDKTLLKIR